MVEKEEVQITEAGKKEVGKEEATEVKPGRVEDTSEEKPAKKKSKKKKNKLVVPFKGAVLKLRNRPVIEVEYPVPYRTLEEQLAVRK